MMRRHPVPHRFVTDRQLLTYLLEQLNSSSDRPSQQEVSSHLENVIAQQVASPDPVVLLQTALTHLLTEIASTNNGGNDVIRTDPSLEEAMAQARDALTATGGSPTVTTEPGQLRASLESPMRNAPLVKPIATTIGTDNVKLHHRQR